MYEAWDWEPPPQGFTKANIDDLISKELPAAAAANGPYLYASIIVHRNALDDRSMVSGLISTIP